MLRVPETPQGGALPASKTFPVAVTPRSSITVNVQRWGLSRVTAPGRGDAAQGGALRGPPALGLDLDSELVQAP